ncbi:hypothetical protein [Tritonibacter mobilis]|uniref:hypothetical protein n=2 Tax=Tritonibacter mobilis TaxID=379347 RepID=UPI000AAC5FEB|nr:hypothetical protein [Tritonibacter mobilis]
MMTRVTDSRSCPLPNHAARSPASRAITATLFLLITTMFMAPMAGADEITVYTIADEIYAQNDCTDQSNEECRAMFENTCTWAGDAAIIVRDGYESSVSLQRISEKILEELGEVGIGSGGYIDTDLAISMLDPISGYFMFGQYEVEFSDFNNRAKVAIAMVAGARLTGGDTTAKDVEETRAMITQKRDNAIRTKWYNNCMRSAYF